MRPTAKIRRMRSVCATRLVSSTQRRDEESSVPYRCTKIFLDFSSILCEWTKYRVCSLISVYRAHEFFIYCATYISIRFDEEEVAHYERRLRNAGDSAGWRFRGDPLCTTRRRRSDIGTITRISELQDPDFRNERQARARSISADTSPEQRITDSRRTLCAFLQ